MEEDKLLGKRKPSKGEASPNATQTSQPKKKKTEGNSTNPSTQPPSTSNNRQNNSKRLQGGIGLHILRSLAQNRIFVKPSKLTVTQSAVIGAQSPHHSLQKKLRGGGGKPGQQKQPRDVPEAPRPLAEPSRAQPAVEGPENDPERLEAFITGYKKMTKKPILKHDLFLKPVEAILTPQIFTKKNFVGNSVVTEEVIAFEYVLGLVCKLYYKANFGIEDYIGMFNKLSNLDKSGPKSARNGTKSRRGKRKKTEQQSEKAQEDSQDLESQDQLSGELQSYIVEPPTDAALDCLERLITPIRDDKEFEKWTLKEIAIFECSICYFGKRFDLIQSMVLSKSINEIMSFFLSWKRTSHYRIWKHHKNLKKKSYPGIV